MRKYIHMAKATKPILTEAARKYITEQYSILRSNDMQRKDCDRVGVDFLMMFRIHIISA